MAEFDSNPYSVPSPAEFRSNVVKHSLFGIASLALSVLSSLGMLGAIVAAGLAVSSNDDPQSPVLILLGFAILGLFVLSLLAVILGIIGLVQRDRKKILAILGVALSAITLLLVIGLMVLGTVVG